MPRRLLLARLAVVWRRMGNCRLLAHVVVFASLLAALPSCLETSGPGPLRSPSNDYRPPPPTTADGQVIGADRVAPAEKLTQGATSNGAAPGRKVNSQGISYDPKKRVGGQIDQSDDSKSESASPPRRAKATPSP